MGSEKKEKNSSLLTKWTTKIKFPTFINFFSGYSGLRTHIAKNLGQNTPWPSQNPRESTGVSILSDKLYPMNSFSVTVPLSGGSVLPWILPCGVRHRDTLLTSSSSLLTSLNNLCIPWDVLMMVWMTMMTHCWENQNLFYFSCHLQGNQVHSQLWEVNLHPAIN